MGEDVLRVLEKYLKALGAVHREVINELPQLRAALKRGRSLKSKVPLRRLVSETPSCFPIQLRAARGNLGGAIRGRDSCPTLALRSIQLALGKANSERLGVGR